MSTSFELFLMEGLGFLLLLWINTKISARISRFLQAYLDRNRESGAALFLVSAAIIGWLIGSFCVGGLYAFGFWLVTGV